MKRAPCNQRWRVAILVSEHMPDSYETARSDISRSRGPAHSGRWSTRGRSSATRWNAASGELARLTRERNMRRMQRGDEPTRRAVVGVTLRPRPPAGRRERGSPRSPRFSRNRHDCLTAIRVSATHEELLYSDRPAVDGRKAVSAQGGRRRDRRGCGHGRGRLPAATARAGRPVVGPRTQRPGNGNRILSIRSMIW